jgi:serine/threonine-protein kinase
MLPPGTIIAGYRIDGVLGQGGMGTVYEATQLSLERVVALKLLAAHLSDDVGFRARFKREGQVQARLEHPHIVTVYEAGETEHGLFIAMRLVRGRTLKDLVNARELDPARTLAILAPVAQALDEAHGMGLIHRDIKPQNVLVGARDHSFLADFGLTKGTGETSLTRTGHFVGTFDYISPEQINGEQATAASDVYSLAGVLYECLTGSVPYPKTVEAAVLYAHVADPPPQPTAVRPELPGELDAIVARAMAKDPAARYASAGELIGEVERAFAPPPPPETRASAVPAPPPEDTRLATPVADRTAAGPTAPVPRPAPPPRAPAAPAKRSAALPLLGVGALALVIAAGFLIGKAGSDEGGDPPAEGTAVTAGALEATAPGGWEEGGTPVLALRDSKTLFQGADGPANVSVGMSTATGPTLLPPKLSRGNPDAKRKRIGELEALLYSRIDSKTEGPMRVYAAPTSGGVATVACALPDVGGTPVADDCDRIAGSLELTEGKGYPLGPDKAYEKKLNRAIKSLNAAAPKQAKQLRSAENSAGQASAANALSDSYGNAAKQLSDATDNPMVSGANEDVVRALRDVSDAYDRLAAAARKEDEAAYASARADVRQGKARLAKALRSV